MARILIVDDDQGVLHSAKMFLKDAMASGVRIRLGISFLKRIRLTYNGLIFDCFFSR